MASLKKLASQTAYYGLSSILGRMLNYLLVPLHTRVLPQHDYGVIGEFYAYISFINIIFLFGMETAFFRFASQSDDKRKIFSTAFITVAWIAILLASGIALFAQPILGLLSEGTVDSSVYQLSYVYLLAAILAIDAICAIPFAKIRLDNKPKKFAGIRMANIIVYVFFNFYFLVFCPWYVAKNPSSIWVSFYQATDMVFYIFFANLLASITTLLLLHQEILQVQLRIAMDKLKPMLVYSIPLLFAGLAGMVNETLDRLLLKYYLPGSIESRLTQIGIYNAAYKLSIFMTLATQAFRMAAEPFFFKVATESNAKDTYARVMRYYVIVCCAIFLGVMTHINFIETLIGPDYRSGLHVVPILLLANLFFGIYLNLSIWFKLSDKTYYGLYFTILGAVITIALNIYLIPIYGFVASAYTTLACYFIMMLACYAVGQKYYPVAYEIRKALFYFIMMLAFYFFARSLESFIGKGNLVYLQLAQSAVFILFVAIAYREDFRNKKFA